MSESYNKAYRIHNVIKQIGVWIAGLDTVAIMLFICADVLKRNITGSSIAGSYEIIQGYMMALTTFTAIPYAYSAGVMPRVDLIINKMKPKNKRLAVNSMLVLDIIIFAVLTVISSKYAAGSFARKMTFVAGTKYYPVYPLHLLPPLAFIMIVFENIFVLIRNIKLNKDDMFIGEGNEVDAKQKAQETVF
jgi:TRAP-type C4-dicarboxylate transport system permease small subunit